MKRLIPISRHKAENASLSDIKAPSSSESENRIGCPIKTIQVGFGEIYWSVDSGNSPLLLILPFLPAFNNLILDYFLMAEEFVLE